MDISRENYIIGGSALAIGLIIGSSVTKFFANRRFRKIDEAAAELEEKLRVVVPAE